VRGELGRHPITIKAISRSLKYFNQINCKSENKLVKQALTECMDTASKGRVTWYTKLKRLTQQIKIPLTDAIVTKYQLKKLTKSREKTLEERYTKYWHQQLNSPISKTKNKGGNKLRTYSKLKQHFKLEKYLTLLNNTAHRKALTQLRLSSHQLHIETLRGTIRDPKDRICPKCNLNKTEDEVHFVTECPYYSTHREPILTKLGETPNTSSLNNEDQFIWLLTAEDKDTCQKLGKYIYDCFVIRKGNPENNNT